MTSSRWRSIAFFAFHHLIGGPIVKLSKHHTARSLAELHAHLGDAVAALRLAAMLRDDKGPGGRGGSETFADSP